MNGMKGTLTKPKTLDAQRREKKVPINEENLLDC